VAYQGMGIGEEREGGGAEGSDVAGGDKVEDRGEL